MKKSMLNVIILALVLVNLVLTVILTFSLVSTNKKTNSLINKVAQIIDLDVAGGVSNNNSSTGSGIENVSYIDIKNNDSTEKQDMPYFQYLSDLIQKLRIIVLYRLQLIMG